MPHTITVTLDDEEYDWLAAASARSGRPAEEIARAGIVAAVRPGATDGAARSRERTGESDVLPPRGSAEDALFRRRVARDVGGSFATGAPGAGDAADKGG
ncbi:MAG TPA: hypothetical protein VLJ14_13095 [Ktedonobacterales bacterium]|nr:hypothetical protein [Ktedonobacterales bacterium]